MADNENGEIESDITITGPDEGGGTDTTECVVHVRHVYRIDFEDGTTKEYVASNDIAAIYLARHDKPGAERLQISRVRKNVIAAEKGMVMP